MLCDKHKFRTIVNTVIKTKQGQMSGDQTNEQVREIYWGGTGDIHVFTS